MSRHLDVEKIVQAIPKVPAQIGQITAFVATLVGFVRLWQQGPEIVGIIMLALGVSVLCILLAYVAYGKTPPLVVGGSEKWRFPRWRAYALAGLVLVPLLAVGSLTFSLLRPRPEQAPPSTATVVARSAATQELAAQPSAVVADPSPPSTRATSAPQATSIVAQNASSTAVEPAQEAAHVILLADFVGPEPGKHRVTEAIGEQLARAFPAEAATVLRLGRAINDARGTEDALAEGSKAQVKLVVWGRYSVEIDRVAIVLRATIVGGPEQRLIHAESAGQLRALVVAEPTTLILPCSLATEMPEVGWLAAGLQHYQAARWDQAVAALDSLLGLTLAKQPLPDYAAMIALRGIARLRVGQVDQALADFGRAVEIDSRRIEGWIDRGNAHYIKDNYEQAIADYGQAITLNSKDSRAYANRGLALYDQGEGELGMVDYDQAIELDAHLAAALFNRGNAHYDNDELEKAINDYDRAIAADVSFAEAWFMRGVMQRLREKSEAALADLNQAIALQPNLVEAYNNRGLVYENLDDLDRAAEDYDKALALRPNYMPATVNRGNIYYQRDDWQRALAYYDRAIKLAPDTPQAHHNRGYALYQLKQYESALESVQRALELAPNDPDAWTLQGKIRHATGHYAEAIEDYDNALSLEDGAAEIYYQRGISYSELGQAEQAIADLERCLELEPDPEIHRKALETLKKLGAR